MLGAMLAQRTMEHYTSRMVSLESLKTLQGPIIESGVGHGCRRSSSGTETALGSARKSGDAIGGQGLGPARSSSMVTFRCIFVMEFCDAGDRQTPMAPSDMSPTNIARALSRGHINLCVVVAHPKDGACYDHALPTVLLELACGI